MSLSNLVKNELIKIFKKKTIYITMVVIFLLLIFMNCMFKYANSGSEYDYYLYNENYINSLRGELETLNPEKSSDVTTYINLLSEIQLSEMMEQHKDAEWKLAIINERIAPYITERNTYQYGAEKNQEQVAVINQEIDDLLTKLDENDWKYFAREDLAKAEQQIEELNSQKEQTEDKAVLENIETELDNAQMEKEIAEIRLNKEIPYGTDYLNRAISNLQTANTSLANFKNIEELTYQEKLEYNSYLEDQAESRYILETGNENYQIKIDNTQGSAYSILNKDGEQITTQNYSYINYLYDNYFIVSVTGGKVGVINDKEEPIIEIQYDSIEKVEGTDYIITRLSENNSTQLYDKNFKQLCEMTNAIIRSQENYVKMYNDTETRYFDLEGNEKQNTEILSNNQIYAKSQDGKWGFVDKSGNVVVDYIYDKTTDLNSYGYAGVKLDGKWGVVNANGEVIVEPTYTLNTQTEPEFIKDYYKVEYGYGEFYYTK